MWGVMLRKLYLLLIFLIIAVGASANFEIKGPVSNTTITGLQSGYHMDEASGNAVDFGGAGYTARVTGVTYQQEGVYNYSYKFPGTNNYLNRSTGNHLASFTYLMWFYKNKAGVRHTMVSDGIANNKGIFMEVDAYERIHVTMGISSSTTELYTAANFPLKTWTLVGLTYNATTRNVTIWKDGVKATDLGAPNYASKILASALVYDTTAGSSGLSFGEYLNGLILPANGSMDDIRIYDHELTAAQMMTIYQSVITEINITSPANNTIFGVGESFAINATTGMNGDIMNATVRHYNGTLDVVNKNQNTSSVRLTQLNSTHYILSATYANTPGGSWNVTMGACNNGSGIKNCASKSVFFSSAGSGIYSASVNQSYAYNGSSLLLTVSIHNGTTPLDKVWFTYDDVLQNITSAVNGTNTIAWHNTNNLFGNRSVTVYFNETDGTTKSTIGGSVYFFVETKGTYVNVTNTICTECNVSLDSEEPQMTTVRGNLYSTFGSVYPTQWDVFVDVYDEETLTFERKVRLTSDQSQNQFYSDIGCDSTNCYIVYANNTHIDMQVWDWNMTAESAFKTIADWTPTLSDPSIAVEPDGSKFAYTTFVNEGDAVLTVQKWNLTSPITKMLEVNITQPDTSAVYSNVDFNENNEVIACVNGDSYYGKCWRLNRDTLSLRTGYSMPDSNRRMLSTTYQYIPTRGRLFAASDNYDHLAIFEIDGLSNLNATRIGQTILTPPSGFSYRGPALHYSNDTDRLYITYWRTNASCASCEDVFISQLQLQDRNPIYFDNTTLPRINISSIHPNTFIFGNMTSNTTMWNRSISTLWFSNMDNVYTLEDLGTGYLKDEGNTGINPQIVGANYETGRYGKSLYFDGANADHLQFGKNSKFDLNQNMTISHWIKASSIGYSCSTDDEIVWGKLDGIAQKSDYALAICNLSGTTPSVLFWRSDGGGSNLCQIISSIPYQEWFHLIVTQTGTAVKIYVNGTESASGTCTYDYSADSALQVGCGNFTACNSDKDFKGYIDEFQLMSTGITPQEANELFRGNLRHYQVGEWRFSTNDHNENQFYGYFSDDYTFNETLGGLSTCILPTAGQPWLINRDEICTFTGLDVVVSNITLSGAGSVVIENSNITFTGIYDERNISWLPPFRWIYEV